MRRGTRAPTKHCSLGAGCNEGSTGASDLHDAADRRKRRYFSDFRGAGDDDRSGVGAGGRRPFGLAFAHFPIEKVITSSTCGGVRASDRHAVGPERQCARRPARGVCRYSATGAGSALSDLAAGEIGWPAGRGRRGGHSNVVTRPTRPGARGLRRTRCAELRGSPSRHAPTGRPWAWLFQEGASIRP